MAAPILIVDDDPDIRESLGDMLSHEGYRVQSVPDGSEALQCVKHQRYSAALLDIQLPDLDGLSVLKVMMELDPDLPIIILTGHASTENTIGSLVKGAFAYLTKPYNKQELTAILRRAVSVKRLVVRAEHVEQALLASEQRFRALVESASDAIVLSDQGGHIIWWNAAAERLFAYPKDEVLGRTLSMLMPERFRPAHEAGLARLAAGGERYDVVLAMEVVEHVVDVGAFLETCAAMVKPGGLLIAATLNRTLKSFALAIVGAEYILRWLPRGTHQWDKFVKPQELESAIERSGLQVIGERGVIYNPFADRWQLSSDMDVNYMLVARRPNQDGEKT